VALPAEQRLVFNFRNSVNVAVGVEKALSPRLTVRTGYLIDRSPVTDASVGPFFPDSTRDSFTIGATRRSGNKEFAFFYEAMHFRDRVTNVAANNNVFTNGDYHNFAHLFGISMRFNKDNY
jgi:long-subunit fatty acid transport protein